jgi:hypothetical protein
MYGIQRIFKANCGSGARYIWSELSRRGEHDVVVLEFEIVPERRRFKLDGVIHPPGDDAAVRAAVERIADIAKNVRVHLAPGPVPERLQ